MYYEFVAPVLSVVSAGLSYWYSRVARAARDQTTAPAASSVTKTIVQSPNHEVCSECNKLVARFERREDGSIQCANCLVKG